MPTNYSGNPANITTPLSATITNIVGSSGLCLVTTASAHLFGNNDIVSIQGVSGSTGNGVWPITVVSATQFTLNGSSFSGTYTSGGTALDSSLTPYYQIPSDGDNDTAESILPALSALGDRTQQLNRNRIVGTFFQQLVASVNVTNSSYTTVWSVTWTPTTLMVGDLIMIDVIARVSGVASTANVGLSIFPQIAGATPPQIFGQAQLTNPGASEMVSVPVNWIYTIPPEVVFNGQFTIVVQMKAFAGDSVGIYGTDLSQPSTIRMTQIRP